MATICNRSAFTVTVAEHPELKRSFPFNDQVKAVTYCEELLGQKYKPILAQAEDQILVRIRQRGYPDFAGTYGSFEEAEDAASEIERSRRRGDDLDYTKARRVTFAALIKRYYREECPQHKGCAVERAVLKSMLRDSGADIADLDEPKPSGPPTVRKSAVNEKEGSPKPRRPPRTHLEWFHLPFADIQPDQIEAYKRARLAHAAPATVDRELDLIAQVMNKAVDSWWYHLRIKPMKGVARPKYFNERDRRLVGDEEERLFAAIREEDRIRSFNLAIEADIAQARVEATDLANRTARSRHVAAARKRAIAARGGPLNDSTILDVTPLYEAYCMFLLCTTARGSEACRLTWADTRLSQAAGYFPQTKNGRARAAPLRQNVIDLINRLPRTSAQVFPITKGEMAGVWSRACDRAAILDFTPHGLRHEGISQIAENGHLANTPFTLVDLASISGHRDLRMLMRYAHLCAGALAKRLDEVFARARQEKDLAAYRKGRIPVMKLLPPSHTNINLENLRIAAKEPIDAEGRTIASASSTGNVILFKRRD